MTLGQVFCDLAIGSSVSPTGEVVNLSLAQAGPNTVSAQWDYLGADMEQVDFAVYVNGLLALTTPAKTATVFVAEADVAVDVLPRRRVLPSVPYHVGSATPTKAFLAWPPVAAGDLAAYKVFDGTQFVARLSAFGVEAGAVAGSLGGLLYVAGAYRGDVSNGTMTVTKSGAALTVSCGNKTATLPAVPGQWVEAMDGVLVSLLPNCPNNSQFSFRVGILPRAVVRPAGVGVRQFSVVAVDKAGNESETSPAVPVYVTARPLPLSNKSIAVGPDKTLFFRAEALPSHVGGVVKVYSNFDPVTQALSQAVSFDAPIASASIAAAGLLDVRLFEATGKPDGRYLFVGRVSVAGVDDDSAEILTLDLPIVRSHLPAPFGLTGTPLPGGAYRFTWFATSRWETWLVIGIDVPGEYVPAIQSVGVAWQYTLDLDYKAIGGDQRTVVIAASDGNDVGPSASLVIEADPIGPDTPGTPVGVGT
jgi:hypothetical protein